MSLFPIAADKIQLTDAAVDASDAYQNGVRVTAGTPLARAATSGGAQYNNGLPMSNTGQVIYVDTTAGLPADTQFTNGIPLSAGAVCISTDDMATYSNGLPMAANGAVSCVVTP